MNTQKHRWILYLIVITIITTITVQAYWNYKNYKENKRLVTNEIQLSLDNAIEEYYAKIAKNKFTTIIGLQPESGDSFLTDNINLEMFSKDTNLAKMKDSVKSHEIKPSFTIENISINLDENFTKVQKDSMVTHFKELFNDKPKIKAQTEEKASKIATKIKNFTSKKNADSLQLIKKLKPIFFSITSNAIIYKELDSLIKNQLLEKKIPIDYKINHLKNDTLFYASNDSLPIKKFTKSVSSKSTYVKKNEEIKLRYNHIKSEVLKRSFFGITLSLLLSLAVISSLFYLLKIINQQKELATIKNDLISNITHEFKTPIATISAAIEAIKNFNVLEDREKTHKYLSLSSIQINKLHQMVEKLLETAMLDSEQLALKKESIDLIDLAERLVSKHQILTHKKELSFSTNLQPCYANVDVFHFENVISNLIDNAVKYGGDKIEININSTLNSIEITLADNGVGIEKNQQEKIFDKFYRVPKGNTHDIKGFGIGLYYCKKIIEKHEGSISISSDKKQTIFKITISNE